MGIIEIIGIVTGVVTLATYVVKLIGEIKTNTAATKLTDTERLIAVAEMAVATAEQYGKTDAWSSEMKRDYAVAAVRKGFPQLGHDTVRHAVEAAVALFNKATGK